MHGARERTGVPGVAAGLSRRRRDRVRRGRRARARRGGARARRDAVSDRVDLEAVHRDARRALPRARRRRCGRCSATPPAFAASRPSRCRQAAGGCGRTRTPATGRPARGRRRGRLVVRRGDARRTCSSRSGSRRPATTSRPACAAGTCRRARPGSARRSRTRTRSRGGRRAGSGRPSATCCASAGTTSTRTRRCTSRRPRRSVRGTRSAGGCATSSGRVALDHEGSVAGYQSLLLLVPEERARPRGAHEQLARQRRDPAHRRARSTSRRGAATRRPIPADVAGVYALDGVEATVALDGDVAARHGGRDGSGDGFPHRAPVSGARARRRCLRLREAARCRATGSTFRARTSRASAGSRCRGFAA